MRIPVALLHLQAVFLAIQLLLSALVLIYLALMSQHALYICREKRERREKERILLESGLVRHNTAKHIAGE